jgi:hypothetical protein
MAKIDMMVKQYIIEASLLNWVYYTLQLEIELA